MERRNKKNKILKYTLSGLLLIMLSLTLISCQKNVEEEKYGEEDMSLMK